LNALGATTLAAVSFEVVSFWEAAAGLAGVDAVLLPTKDFFVIAMSGLLGRILNVFERLSYCNPGAKLRPPRQNSSNRLIQSYFA
jgi:hypothetical protein